VTQIAGWTATYRDGMDCRFGHLGRQSKGASDVELIISPLRRSVGRRSATIFGAAVLAVAITPGAAQATTAKPTVFSVSCRTVIGTQLPTASGYRIVLGRISVPPSYNPQVVPVRGHWPYWRKAGMAVRAGNTSVTVSVPIKWRSRVGITWGNSPVVETLRFSGCGPGSGGSDQSTPRAQVTNSWNGYAGGFYLREPSACVPLVFTSGNRSVVAYFGIGQHCRSA
jgi:hypothetical protein